MVSFENIKISNKIIGRGMNGTVYLVKDNKNKKYAMKIQQIMPKDVKESLATNMWREIYFAQTIAKKYPDHFMQLYDHKINNSCTHKQSWEEFNFESKDLPKAQQTYYKKLFASPHCSIKLWSYVDTTLDNLLHSWKTFHSDIYYDFLIQMIYIVYLMSREGFFHNDFHGKNIGLTKTNKKYITVLNKKINTHGYLVQAIDYELNLHKNYKLLGWQKVKLTNDNDIFTIINLLLFDFADLKHYYKDVDIKEFNAIKIAKEDEKLLLGYLKNLDLSKENYNFLLQILFKLIFYEKYERIILGDKFTKAIPPRLYVPMNVILYMIVHIYEPLNILKYLITNKQ